MSDIDEPGGAFRFSFQRRRPQGGFYEFMPMYVAALPIPAVTLEKRKAVEQLVSDILAAKHKDVEADVSGLEREIDQLAYQL